MKRRSKELLASVSTAVALAVGATACGSSAQTNHEHDAVKQPKVFHINTSNSQGLRIEQAAARMIELSKQSSTRYETKPPYSIGFTVDTDKGGKINYQVQTATPEYKASESELVGVQQTGPNEADFNLSLYAKADGTWTTYCNTDPFSSDGNTVWEEGQKTVHYTSDTVSPRTADASALLDNEISSLDRLVDAAASGNSVAASADICNVNLG